MRLKNLLCVALLFGQTSSETYADAKRTPKECPPHFYLGMVGGLERLNGRRSEGLTLTAGGVQTTKNYTTNYRMLENNGYVSFMGGFLWKFPPLPILIGPEAYFGRGNARSTFLDTTSTYVGNKGLYTTEFSRKLFYGVLLRIGYEFCHKYIVSLSAGYDRSQFLTKRYFAIDNTRIPTVITRTRQLSGYLIGLGLERHFREFIVGIDFKAIQYRRQLTLDPVLTVNAPAQSNFSVRPVVYLAGLRLAYRF